MKTPTMNASGQEFDVLQSGGLDQSMDYDFGLSRRLFVKLLGSGLLLSFSPPLLPQESGRRGGGGFFGSGARTVAARIHFGADGSITVLAGKVEGGQGARAELLQAAAEELRVPTDAVQLLLADTSVVPDDGMTAGSGTTPRTVPAVRQGAAAARNLLVGFACRQWKVDRSEVQVQNGTALGTGSQRTLTYADLARDSEASNLLEEAIPLGVELTPVKDWKVMGTPVLRPNARGIVTGTHRFPSDIVRPGMLYGKVLRRPTYSAKLLSVDIAPTKTIKGVTAVQDGQFVGVVAPNTWEGEKGLVEILRGARWDMGAPEPSSVELFDYLVENAEDSGAQEPLSGGGTVIRRSYQVPYIQHAPLEPRSAVAEWDGDRLTVWTGSQNPFGIRQELAQAFHISPENVRVIIPDFGGAFGGKHTGECAVEAARLARAVKKPVSLRWTREEEFTWAYFRPAGVMQAEASLDAQGRIAAWRFVNINSGPNAVNTPYAVGRSDCRFVRSKPPLRHGSYRGLAATANNFAREAFMDELAAAAKSDPLEFRLAHLQDARLRAVLQKAADEFHWKESAGKKDPNVGVGLACGTEKGSYVAACVEVAIDRRQGTLKLKRVCEAFECGAIVNPANLLSQVQGAIVMGVGAALREEMKFANGKILNASFGQYRVPRFDDVPEMDIHLMDRPDLPSAGAGETPIIAIAPAIANAVFRATGTPVHAIPVRLA